LLGLYQIILKEELGCIDLMGNTKAKAIFPLRIDAEERRGEQEKGLDTQVPLPVNDEW
jgi:hypothetical protein